jgi:cytochrome c553
LALRAAIAGAALLAAGQADAGGMRGGALEAKIDFCKTCHGQTGEGFQAFYSAPRLAGQNVEYIENQLNAMVSHKRGTPATRQFMQSIAGSINPATRKALAKYFSGLDAPPASAARGPGHLAAEGRKIFDEGVPGANVPACAVCHGPDARGIGAVPRLAGQFYSYTVEQLKGWGKGLRSKDPETGDENTMAPIAKGLTGAQINAVAAYVSQLKGKVRWHDALSGNTSNCEGSCHEDQPVQIRGPRCFRRCCILSRRLCAVRRGATGQTILRVVSRRAGARLRDCAQAGRAEQKIHRKSARVLHGQNAQQPVFRKVYVARRAENHAGDVA